MAHENGDIGSRMLFEKIVLDEEGHKAWLDLQLNLLRKIGEQAYFAKYMTIASEETEWPPHLLPRRSPGRASSQYWAHVSRANGPASRVADVSCQEGLPEVGYSIDLVDHDFARRNL